MAKIVACIIARTVSQRLPLKVLRDITTGVSMIEFLIDRIKTISSVDEIYICTSKESVDDIFEDIVIRTGVKIYRGSSDAVIERMIEVGNIEKADFVLRITGDNPFSSVEYVNDQIEFLIQEKLDYVRLVDVPIGASIEVINYEALCDCYSKMDHSVSEYLMLFLFEPNNYRCGIIKPFEQDFSRYSITVDIQDDYIRAKNLVLFCKKDFSLKNIINLLTDDSISDLFPKKEIILNGKVKYPYNQEITFEEFTKDMERRKEESILKNLYE